MNPFLPYVQSLKDSLASAALTSAALTSPAKLATSAQAPAPNSSPKVLLFSPHPDDECLIGLLPLRLMNELAMQVINIPVTFGSAQGRQRQRAEELAQACRYLGWQIHQEREDLAALERSDIINILTKYQPEVIFFPHERDWNSRHISTHHLLMQALAQMPQEFSCHVVESEYWGAMDDPNIMVEADVETLATLVAATSFHLGEISRNPYHLSLPCWMQDNVRRGSELVGGQGGHAPAFTFATLYRARYWQQGKLQPSPNHKASLPMGAAPLKEFFKWQ